MAAGAGAPAPTTLSEAQAARTTERMVGITEYASAHAGFRGTNKYRYSDFIVREISRAKEEVRLTDKADAIMLPPGEVVTSTAAATEAGVGAGGEQGAAGAVSAAGVAEMETLVGKETAERIMALVKKNKDATAAGTEHGDAKAWEVVLEPDADKAKRTAVHKCVRTHFAPLESDSVKVGDVTAVRVFHPLGNGGAWREGALRGRDSRTQQGGAADERARKKQKTQVDALRIDPKYKYVRFTLFKENRDTMGAISELCRLTQLQPRKFSYAGTKDRRACTAQHVTVTRGDARHLLNVNKRVRFGMVLGNFTYCEEELRLGDLYGNRFELALRDVDADDASLRAACESLRARGFINYFGLQRFGTSAVPTHEIGRALLQDDFAKAAELILCPRAGEKEESQGVRLRYQKEQNAAEALKYFPKYMHAERSLLEGYVRHGMSAHQTAVQGLPRNLRLMYVHAYQSYVWNCIASARVRAHGVDKAVEGDLVLVNPAAAEADADVVGDSEAVLDDVDDKAGKARTVAHPKQVKVLTAEEAAAASISDVVLPQPGISICYPTVQGAAKGDYGAIMQADGIDIDKMETKAREFTLTGDYRRLMAAAEDLVWEPLAYSDAVADLQASDKDLLAGRSNADIRQAALTPKEAEGGAVGGGGKVRKALLIAFTLRSSTYATMCLRELLKEHSEEAALGLRDRPDSDLPSASLGN